TPAARPTPRTPACAARGGRPSPPRESTRRSRRRTISRSGCRGRGPCWKSRCMLPFRDVTPLDEAVARAQHHLLSRQAADGHWVGELEADRALTAEVLLLHRLIDRFDPSMERRALTYLRRRQNQDGGWSLYEGGP